VGLIVVRHCSNSVADIESDTDTPLDVNTPSDQYSNWDAFPHLVGFNYNAGTAEMETQVHILTMTTL
jgi:hypothetical protein